MINFRSEKVYLYIMRMLNIFVIIFAMLLFYYTDISDTLDNSVLLVKSVVSGRFHEFYSFAVENINPNTIYAANYDILIYIIFAVWNLPVIIAHFLWGLDYMNSIWALIWCKGLIVLALAGISYFMKKIDEYLQKEKEALPISYTILLFTSPVVFLSSLIALQYDCILLFFMVAGLYYYIAGKYKMFLLFFYFAVPLKLFAIFLLLPLILLKEKNLFRAGVQFGCSFIVPILLKLFYSNDSAYVALIGTQNRDAGGLIRSANISIGSVQFNLFVAIYMAVCVFSYLYNTLEENKYLIIYISACVYSAVILFIPIRSYWIILAEPFLLLLVGLKREKFTVNLLIHTGAGFAGLIYYIYDHWIYSWNGMTSKLLVGTFLTKPEYTKYGTIRKFLDSLAVADYMPLLRTVFITGILLLLWINRPQSEGDTEVSNRYWKILMMLRGCFLFCICCVFIYASYKGDTAPCFSTFSGYDSAADSYVQTDLSQGASISQNICLNEACEITRLSFICHNEHTERNNIGSLIISLADIETGEIFVQEQVFCSLIKNKVPYEIKFPEISLPAGEYVVTFTGVVTSRSFPIYMASVLISESESRNTAFFEGEACPFSLCVQLQ